jgi:hypothetical protein
MTNMQIRTVIGGKGHTMRFGILTALLLEISSSGMCLVVGNYLLIECLVVHYHLNRNTHNIMVWKLHVPDVIHLLLVW